MILMAVIALFGVLGLYRLDSEINEAYAGNTFPTSQLWVVRAAQLDVQSGLRRLQATRSVDDVTKTLPEIQTALDAMNRSWVDYHAGTHANEEYRNVDSINTALAEFTSHTTSVMAAFKARNFDAAADLLNRSEDQSDSLTKALSVDASLNLVRSKQIVEGSASTFRNMLLMEIASLSVGVLVASGACAYLLQAFTRLLKQALVIANDIANGQLKNPAVVASGGRSSQLIGALNKMDQKLSAMVRGIKASADSISVTSREIAKANLDLSVRTEEQATSLEETAASMTRLTETVKQNANNAQQANALATSATDIAETGNEAVQSMVGTIKNISSSSSKISEITSVIEGIAFQTNILALNAAVEAARAGEQGRGFAVVASEVRSLAQRSAAAAKEIKELIESSVAMIQNGSKQATEAGANMAQVKWAIKQVSDIVGEIAAASEEQSRGIKQINQAVTQMDEVTQQNAALVEQAATAAQSLEEQATNLKEAVSVFTFADLGSTAQGRRVTKSPSGGIAASNNDGQDSACGLRYDR